MPFADSLSVSSLMPLIGSARAPLVWDVRSDQAFEASSIVLPGARRVKAGMLPLAKDPWIAVYCKAGRELAQGVAAGLRAQGFDARWLEGGIEAWTAAGGVVVARKPEAQRFDGVATRWVTRRKPKIDRAACPWFVQRFIDRQAEFLFVERPYVLDVAAATGAIAFDIEGAPVTHDGERCSFDTLLDRYEVKDPVLRKLAVIVRGADTDDLKLAPEAAGLKAMSLGLSALEDDDHAMIRRAFNLYDALYAYLRFATQEAHGWPSKA